MKKLLLLLSLILFPAAICSAEVTIHAVGDVMIGTLFPEKRIPPENGASIFKWATEYLTNGSPDIVMGNLEGALTHYSVCSKRIRKGYTYAFRMPPESAYLFTNAGFNVFTMANNHSMDFGDEGYREGRKILNGIGIKVAGYKREVSVMNVDGKKVAIVAFAYFDRNNNILKIKESADFIREVAASNDIVVISVHGGAEGEAALHTPRRMETHLGEQRGNMVEFSRRMIDAGADIVIGHGPHLPRAMEIYNGRLIAYSLGNFATYGMSTQGHKKLTLVLRANLGDQGEFLSGKIVPMIQREDGGYNGIPQFDPQGRTTELIRRLSKEDFPESSLEIQADGTLLPVKK